REIRDAIRSFILKLLKIYLSLSDHEYELRSQYEKERSLNKRLKGQLDQLKLRNDSETNATNWDDQNNEEHLISSAAHELRAPLNRHLGLATLIQSTHLTESQREIVDLMIKVSNEGLYLIDDILHADSVVHKSIEHEWIDIGPFINDHIGSFLAEQARSKKIQLHVEFNGQLEMITDTTLLKRILDNIISNAIKFSHPNTHVFITVQGTEKSVSIAVRDQGPGISNEDQLKMFKKFQKLSARPTSGESSNGLGLVIVKHAVERLQGEISVQSSLGNGTEFVVQFNKKEDVRRDRKLVMMSA
ncbi:MAG: HAMP domain-containing sensor histidine kinase, partial [Chryseolinea sp.]